MVADLVTSLGTLSCELFLDRAPQAVARFVGLARGEIRYRSRSGWTARPAYDGSRFHRVVRDRLVAGGRPRDAHADGLGLPPLPPERWPGMRHDEPGLLCSAARGRRGAGEILVTAGDASHLDGDGGPALTVFGRCYPVDLAARLSRVPSERGRPLQALVLRRVRLRRGRVSGATDDGGDGKTGGGRPDDQ